MHSSNGEQADRLRRIGDVFREHGYAVEALRALVGRHDLDELRMEDLGLAHKRTSDGSGLATLARLFLLNMPVDLEAARRACAPVSLEEWVDAGFLAVKDGAPWARVKMQPYEDLILAIDPPQQERFSTDHVMGVAKSSILLATATIRKPARAALDLGSGCGIQSLLAARHSHRVVAADCNPRAVHRTFVNAVLNGLDNVDSREGDLFAPVEGERFDLVVTNPPFVISPDKTFIFRDSGMPGDGVTRTIARSVHEHLEEGGFCQMVCDWVRTPGEGEDRLATWFEGTGCDAWVLRSTKLAVESYASAWVGQTEGKAPSARIESFQRWLDYYRREGIEEIGSGIITIRKRSTTRNWFDCSEAPERMIGNCGDDVLRHFSIHDWLDGLSDDEMLLDVAFTASPRLRMHQEASPGSGHWDLVESHVQMVSGLTHRARIDPHVARLLAGCDGTRELRSLLAEMAANLDTTIDVLAGKVLGLIRSMVVQGFLDPPSE